MPSTRMDELYALAEMRDGLLTSKEAREAGIADSVLVRLAQRGRLERVSRGGYRIWHYPVDRLAQYREAVLWAKSEWRSYFSPRISRDCTALIRHIRCQPCKSPHHRTCDSAPQTQAPQMDHHSSCGHQS
ncbi:type IV toxin-antitoxin system AbiEi family antitoxin domain-containing protein [Silvibacterium acidisoli]|uniref:type IV toxin-antitoxin system AbiEi family antitoxin domain-containing protein n=1 Tax=Acidobacteriaceae bacterium ZG23-2 TaxID=2883246 RepID=UPI00406D1525